MQMVEYDCLVDPESGVTAMSCGLEESQLQIHTSVRTRIIMHTHTRYPLREISVS